MLIKRGSLNSLKKLLKVGLAKQIPLDESQASIYHYQQHIDKAGQYRSCTGKGNVNK